MVILSFFFVFFNFEYDILGIHSEGAVIQTLINLLFLDLIYSLPTPDLLIDLFQTEPLDFHTDTFYTSRQSQIDERISRLNSEEVSTKIQAVSYIYTVLIKM